MRIYPNPVTDYLVLESKEMEGKEIIILDLLGNPVWHGYARNDRVIINISDLSTGVYIFKIEETEKMFMKG